MVFNYKGYFFIEIFKVIFIKKFFFSIKIIEVVYGEGEEVGRRRV